MTKVILFRKSIPTIIIKLIEDLNINPEVDSFRFNCDLIKKIEEISIEINCVNDVGFGLIALSNDIYAIKENKFKTIYYASYNKPVGKNLVQRETGSFTIETYDETIPHIIENEHIKEIHIPRLIDKQHNIWSY